MSLAIATLRRHGRLVWLHERRYAPRGAPRESTQKRSRGGTAPDTANAPAPPTEGGSGGDGVLFDISRGERRRFWREGEAEHYLRGWLHDAEAVRELRLALKRLDPSAWVFSLTDAQVLRALATRVAEGTLVVTEAAPPPKPPSRPGAPPPAAPPAEARPAMAAAPAPAQRAAQPQAPASVQPQAPVVPEVPLLPLLEEVQIEGAEVLPEIMQTLEQIDLTLGEIALAPVSLAPTPSKIPEIKSAMSEASNAVTETLDAL